MGVIPPGLGRDRNAFALLSWEWDGTGVKIYVMSNFCQYTTLLHGGRHVTSPYVMLHHMASITSIA